MRITERVAAYPWRLRTAWATGKPVSVRLEIYDDEIRQAVGWVLRVSVTDSFVLLRLDTDQGGDPPLHLPIDERVLSVTLLDHFSETQLRRRSPPVQESDPNQLSLLD